MSSKKRNRKIEKQKEREQQQKSAAANAPVPRRDFAKFMQEFNEVRRELKEARTAITVLTLVLEERNIITQMDLGKAIQAVEVKDIQITIERLKSQGVTKDALIAFLLQSGIDPKQYLDLLELEK